LEAVVLSIEVVALALGVSILTAMGWGPFAVVGNVSRPATLLIQIFLLTTASFAVLVNAAQYERRAVATRLASREQLLRGGFVQSRVGLMIIEAGPKGLVVVERNRIVEQVLASELSTRSDDPDLLDWSGAVAGDFLSTVRAGGEEFSTTLHAESGDVDLDVLVNALEGSLSLFTVQLIDATEARKTVRTQQDALEREQRAIANLEELHRQKDEFVASASHELRTPITSILGFAEILTDMHDLPPLGAKSAATIHRNAKRLADLVEDILLLGSPIKTPLSNSRADLAATISDVIESLAPMAAQTKSTVRLGAHVEATTVTVSAPDLSRILTNLISNGLKYSGEGGTVTVSSTSTDGQVVVEISDDGAGMPEEVLARVFERFYRAPGTEGKNIFGTGLGLSLVRRLVNGAGGQVELISSPGQGTSAFVTLLRTGRVDREEESLHG
jgi:two-component system phosphate regulon sensor histidine kinase PhoR